MPDGAKTPRFLTRRTLLRGLGIALVGVAGFEVANVLVGANFHTVIPGAVYRSSQPSADRLERIINRYGIRTVVNFRGADERARWYLDQCRVTSRHGVSEEDFNGSSAGRLPSTGAVRDLLDIIDHADYPILFHCNRGIDRTGLASAVALLLKTDISVAEARRQLGLRYGHLAVGKTGNMDRFFDLYEDWLAKRGATHTSALLRRWMRDEYCPGPCRAEMTVLDAPPTRVHQLPCGLRIRCKNTSVEPWQFRPGNNAGIHLHFTVADDDGKSAAVGRSGQFDTVVAPGDSIVLTLALPVLKPGTYTLRVDMSDEQHASFMQEGSEPLMIPLEVR
jgi:hypothetical protein